MPPSTALLPHAAVLCPSEDELAPLLAHMTEIRTKLRARLRVHCGTLAGLPAAALFSGVCKVNATLAAQMLIDEYRPDFFILSGVAGALDPSLSVFDTVIADACAYHDVAEDILTEYHPYLPSMWFPSDAQLLRLCQRAAENASISVRTGRVVSGEAFVTERERDGILARFHPLAVDMESAAAAHVCYANRVPFLAIRTLTDTADHGAANDFEKNCARASAIAARLTLALLEEIPHAANPHGGYHAEQ